MKLNNNNKRKYSGTCSFNFAMLTLQGLPEQQAILHKKILKQAFFYMNNGKYVSVLTEPISSNVHSGGGANRKLKFYNVNTTDETAINALIKDQTFIVIALNTEKKSDLGRTISKIHSAKLPSALLIKTKNNHPSIEGNYIIQFLDLNRRHFDKLTGEMVVALKSITTI